MSTETIEEGMTERIRQLGPPTYRAVVAKKYADRQKDAALGDSFRVFNRHLRLAPPIDWRQDPFGSRSWKYELHTLQLLDVLFHLYRNEGNLEALDRARRIALDWVHSNGPDEPEVSEFAWYDMAVGLRAPYLAYLLRSGVQEKMLPDEEVVDLLASLRAHGEYLADDANYARGHNHGLFQDEGLFLLADYLPVLDGADAWRELASRRALETLRATVNWEEAVHLEHSPAYHFVIVNLVRRLRRQTGMESEELGELLSRLEETAGWFVLPDGTLPELGDTDLVQVPEWARIRASGALGLRAYVQSGFAIVRTPDSYLITSAGYHSHGHKHADELGFLLVEGGKRIIGDTGRFGYYETEPERIYARSSHGHNTLLVDDQSFAWKRIRPYGSGIRATGEGGGWFAILGENPLLREQGVEHRRLFLYHPTRALVIVDEVASDEEHDYTRLLHFGPDIGVAEDGDLLELRSDGFAGSVHAWTEGGEEARRTERGVDSDRPRGWTFPRDRERRAVTTAEFTRRGSTELFGFAISLSASPLRIRAVEKLPLGFRILMDGEGDVLDLTATTEGAAIQVTEGALS